LAERVSRAPRRLRKPRWLRKLREWSARYLPAEIVGTACAVAGAFVAFQLTGERAIAAIAATVAENVGFYTILAGVEWRRQSAKDDTGAAVTALRTARALSIEFGPAEVLDSVLLRPSSMYLGAVVTGNAASGALLGKLIADALFYAAAITSYEITRRPRCRRPGFGIDPHPQAVRPNVGARTEDDLDRRHGTPVLMMDLDVVADAYRALTTALPDVTVHYAMKCNPHGPVLSRLKSLGSRFEIASAAELDELCAIGVDPAEVLFSNPVKPVDHIARSYATGVRQFAFDSYEELAKLADAAPGSAAFVRLAAHDVGSDVPSEGKFGVDPDSAVALLLAARERGLRPQGIAFHVGSQMMWPHAWQAPLQMAGEVMDKLAADGVYLETVNVGGGFPARYATRPPPLSAYAEVITAGLASLPYPVQALAEPGRVLVAEAGTLVATVIGTATRAGRRWIHLDVGAFNGLMECLETNNRLRFPVTDSLFAPTRELCHLTGPSCDSQDTILFDVDMSAGLSAGDRVYIGSAGAYTAVYASSFNGFTVPTVRCAERDDVPI
jgi:ornithine decarboxylase